MIFNFFQIQVDRLMKRSRQSAFFPSIYVKSFLSFLILLICFAKSLEKYHYANFNPINGTFQNYNPIRRLLDGQIPFVDFYDYLGLGHMYSGAIASLLVGETYQDSLVVFDFLTLLSFSLLSLVIGKCILKNYSNAAIMTIVILLSTMKFKNFEVLNELQELLTPGNSARLIRGMGLPLTTILLVFCIKKWVLIRTEFLKLQDEIIISIILGAISGLSILWSNDYGFSEVGAIIILGTITFINAIYQNRSDWMKIGITYLKITGIYTLTLLTNFFVFGELLTYGNIYNWINITIGVGQYQNWYYNSVSNFYIYDLELSTSTVLQILISIYYVISLQNKGWSTLTVTPKLCDL